MHKLRNLSQRSSLDENKSFLLTLFLSFATLVFTNLDKIKSDSGDMAHHYVLAHGISQDWNVNFVTATNLGGMNFYPHYTHALAAFIGYPINSVFLGMQIVSLFSIALIWTILLRVLWLRSSKPLFATMALILIVLMMRILKLNILPGSEIVDNYFYPQLVGSSFLLFIIYIFISRVQDNYKGLRYAQYIAGFCGAIMISMHLLPALILIGVSLLLTVSKYILADVEESLRKIDLFLDMVFQLLLISYLLSSKTLNSQSEMSETDGELKLGLIHYPSGYWVVVLVSLFGSAWRAKKILRKEKDPSSISIYWTFFGLSVTCLATLQGALLNFGIGSNYAFKKYVFMVVAYLVVELASVASILARTKVKFFKESFFGLIAGSCIVFTVLAYPTVMDTSEIVKIERELEFIKSTSLPEPGKDKSNVIDLINEYPSINYMFAISMTNTRLEDASQEILLKNNVVDYSKYSYVVGSKMSAKYQAYEGCKSITSGEIYVIESSCIQEVILKRGECFSFNIKHNRINFF
jgi:hypothetical protein